MKLARLFAGGLLLAPTLLFAQAQGRIKGVVSDVTGKPIAGAKIIMSCPDIANFHREVVADDKGTYATLVVDATHQYIFEVRADGYLPVKQMAKPLIGSQTLELNFQLKSEKQAQTEAQQQALEQPGFKEAREGQELLEEGKTAEARAKFAAAVAAKPDLYLAWLAMGDIDQKAGKNDDALASAEKCLAAKPEFPQCLALAMNASQGKGDKAGYQKYAERYKVANPSDPVLYYNEAVGFLNKGDDAKAQPLLEKALAADPKYADAMFQLGMVYFRLGDTAKAKEYLQKFLAAAPNHKEAPTAQEMLKYM
ncbi:MAG TPA: tetratricopeptide repeat protein [Thermoanaerobaculaceae bacterium]|nr:tetratricopeptide repeat protein [Thermoanaerobaculaceae bacterium]